MSSRALRKAQKELEERRRLEALGHSEEEDESDAAPSPVSKSKPSLFAMLGDADGGDEEDDDDDEDQPAIDVAQGSKHDSPPASPPPSASRNKKKKKKGKGKAKASVQDSQKVSKSSAKAKSDMDEIDRALLALNLSSKDGHVPDTNPNSGTGEELQRLYAALSVDSRHLHAANEMRKLFGRAALQADSGEAGRAAQRGRAQRQGMSAGGRSLASLGRRNIFVPGKEEWPRATTGGLAMEVEEKRSDGTVLYRFVYTRNYADVQRQFQACVASMDPERILHLLQFNPYHVSTLLQASEIVKQQNRDNATAGDLLERALFTFGRAVHSTFAHNLSQGKARLDFRRPENREFWLAGWRYIILLGIRATWRTAFEWGKLLLSLSPESDPYCMRLLIDQLALRGREAQNLVDLAECDYLERSWKIPPNLAYSVALAHDRLKAPAKARESLRRAMVQYPWIAARLCKELDIEPIPKSVWGKEPLGKEQELLCELYAPKAKDLWNTPEATSLLVEVAYSFDELLPDRPEPYWLAPVNEKDLARHVLLSDDRTLISMLDRRLTSMYTSVSDPLPPDDSILPDMPAQTAEQRERAENTLVHELAQLRTYFERVNMDTFAADMSLEQLTDHLESVGTSLAELRRNAERVEVLRVQLQQLGVQVIFEERRDPQRHEEDSDSDSGSNTE